MLYGSNVVNLKWKSEPHIGNFAIFTSKGSPMRYQQLQIFRYPAHTASKFFMAMSLAILMM